MKNYKIVNATNLFHNLKQFQSKKVCAMVKSNAYGHGIKEIVSLLSDKVDYFGVVSEIEGAQVRRWTDKPIMICGRVYDYRICKKHNLEFMVENLEDVQRAINFGVGDKCHLKINCGMNRFGTKDEKQIDLLDKFLRENKIRLKSIYTHFHFIENKRETEKNYQTFLKLRKHISQNCAICFGGSNIIDYPFDFDMIRVGIGLYGYERDGVLPVMKIVSYIAKIFYVNAGEYVGYGTQYQATHSGFYAVVPIGYGDGLFRSLGDQFAVQINGKRFDVVGNICMDVFFVRIDDSVAVGDQVIVMQNADDIAKKLGSISYEVLTNFSKCRATTKIEQ